MTLIILANIHLNVKNSHYLTQSNKMHTLIKLIYIYKIGKNKEKKLRLCLINKLYLDLNGKINKFNLKKK